MKQNLKGGISIFVDYGPKRYVFSCSKLLLLDFFNFFKSCSQHTVNFKKSTKSLHHTSHHPYEALRIFWNLFNLTTNLSIAVCSISTTWGLLKYEEGLKIRFIVLKCNYIDKDLRRILNIFSFKLLHIYWSLLVNDKASAWSEGFWIE